MASPAKPSSSSLSSIPFKINPNMKKSELNDPMRKSFSGNPFTKPSVITNRRSFNPCTPANSPSDFPRRHSTSREGLASDKENSKDPNPKSARVKSPASSKGAKNFMSPTISAASKINASPRKQILVERNELVRSSVSFCDVKGLIMEDKEPIPEIDLKQKKVSFSDVKSIINEEPTPKISLNQKVSFADDENQEVSFADDESRSSHHEYEEPLKSNANFDQKKSGNDSDLLPETVTEEKDSVNVDPSFKISPRESISPSCPVLSSLDSDPLVLPYDPKTNYLSPRPQFLHYRPNPRITLYQEREGKQLDELFASESYSDTDVTAETSTEGSQIDSEDISSEETKEEGEEEEELHVSETNQSFEAKRMSKPRFSTRSKFITLLLFLGFAYFSVLLVNSPAFAPGLQEISLSNFQVPEEVTEFAKATFDGFTQNLEQWSAGFLSYVSNIMSSSREVHKLGPFQYANLSLLMEDHMTEEKLMFDSSPMVPIWERDAGTELFDEKQYQEMETDEAVDDHENGVFETLELASEQPDEMQQGIQVEMIETDDDEQDQENEAFKTSELADEMQQGIQVEMIELEEAELSVQIEADDNSNLEIKDQQSVISPQATEIHQDVSKTGNPEGQNNIAETLFAEEVKPENLKIEDSAENFQSSEVVDFTISEQEEGLYLTKNNVMGLSLLVLCLLAASAFIYGKRGKPSIPNSPAEQPLPCKRSEYSPVSVGSSSQNWQTEVDMANESSCPSGMLNSYAKTSSYYSNKELKQSDEPCPSEMSSSDRTSSSHSNRGLKESSEYQSQGRKTRKAHRGQSLASSDYSTGSPSYGSFTTLEKIPRKLGGGDEEIVTPVRRSSRIRSQVTSP